MAPFPPWSDLPTELLSEIANFITQNPVDVLHFREVCKSWLSSVSPPTNTLSAPNLPLNLPPMIPFFDNDHVCVLSLTVLYAIRPLYAVVNDGGNVYDDGKTWLVFVDEVTPGKVSIREPFRNAYKLPLDFPRKLNMHDFHVSEVGRFYNISDTTVCSNGELAKPFEWTNNNVKKMVFLSNGLVVVLLLDSGNLMGLKLGDTEWKTIHENDNKLSFDDIIEYKGKVLGIDRRGRVYELSDDLSKMDVVMTCRIAGGGRRRRLVESFGRLYQVIRWNDPGTMRGMGKYKVYELDEEIKKWVEVNSIGDRIFIFGQYYSISTLAQQIDGSCAKNCIIFDDSSFDKYNGGYYSEPWLVTSSLYCSVRAGVYNLEDAAGLHHIESYPGYSNIAWSPPAWLWRSNVFKLHGLLQTAIDSLLIQIVDEELKAKFIELSPMVGALFAVDGDGSINIGNIDIHGMQKQSDMVKTFLSEIVTVLKDELKSINKDLVEEVLSRHALSKFIYLENQEETSNLQAEDRNGSVDDFLNATQLSDSENHWFIVEVRRRAGMHLKLCRFLNNIISIIGENDESKEV